jgi:sugar lactone lactonase YvrE
VQRWLMVCVVAVLIFAGLEVAIAQRSSLTATSLAANPTRFDNAKAGNALPGIESDKTVAVVATGLAPRALAIDPRGNLLLTNAAAPNRIFMLAGLPELGEAPSEEANPAALALMAGNGVAGSLGDGGNALAAQFDLKLDSPVMRSGIAATADGTTFVADTLNATIRRISGSDSSEPGIVRSIAGRWASNQNIVLVEPLGVALDRAGNLYIADRAGGAIDVLPAATSSSPGDQPIPALAHVALPASVALTVDGSKAFVASPDLGAVFQIETQARVIRSLAAFPPEKPSVNGEAVSVCASRGSPEKEHPLVCPAGLAVDGGGNLFVADQNSGSILRLDAKTSLLTTAATGLRSPGDISFDSSGNLYVAEQGAERILKFVSMGEDPSTLTITAPPALPPPPAPRSCPPPASIVPVNSFNFCDQPTGGATPTQAFLLTNNGSVAVTGLEMSFVGAYPGDFQAPSNTCGTSLAAGASCTINVDFGPTGSGSRYASLSVSDAAGDSATANVTGTGDDYELELNASPMEQSVVQGGTLNFNFTITPDAVFGGVVTIVCPSNIPFLSTCTPSASTVTVTPGTPAQFTVTFRTTYNGILGSSPSNGSVPAFLIRRDRNIPSAPASTVGGLVMLVGLAAFAFLWAWSRFSSDGRPLRAKAVPIATLLLTFALASLGGCKHGGVAADLNTPPGSTNLIIQGTAQDAGRGISIILDVVGRG